MPRPARLLRLYTSHLLFFQRLGACGNKETGTSLLFYRKSGSSSFLPSLCRDFTEVREEVQNEWNLASFSCVRCVLLITFLFLGQWVARCVKKWWLTQQSSLRSLTIGRSHVYGKRRYFMWFRQELTHARTQAKHNKSRILLQHLSSEPSSILGAEHPAQPWLPGPWQYQLCWRVSYTLAKQAAPARKLLANFLYSNQKEWSNRASHLLKNFYSETQISWLPIHMGFTCERKKSSV